MYKPWLTVKIFCLTLSIALLSACGDNKNDTSNTEAYPMSESDKDNLLDTDVYPKTKMGGVVDTYFATEVPDPYRWLEDDLSGETADWVGAQNKVTFEYLDKIPYRGRLKNRLEKMWNYEKTTAPFIEGEYTYFYKNDGLQDQYVVYRQKENLVEVFLDPNTFSEDGTTSLAEINFSKDGSLAAYSISEGGSDWRKIIIIDSETKQQLEPPLIDVKFSGISWLANTGFYYSSYDKPDGSELSAKTDQHKLYYHQIGQKQSEDTLVFGVEEKRRYVSGIVTEDDKYLLISGANSTSGNDLYVQDLSKPSSPLITISNNMNSDTNLIGHLSGKLYLETNLNAPNKRLVSVDLTKPQPEHWLDVIAETENVLDVTSGGGYFFADYMIDATSSIYQFSYSGEMIRKIELPGVGQAVGLKGRETDNILYYSFTNYKMPSTIYAFEVKQGGSSIYKKSEAEFDSDQYVSNQIFYHSKDGTKIPMIITHKKGIKLDGLNPTILYGYGGFNISLTPSFSITNAVWMELGGIYAVPNLRGGGEYGHDWHKAGTLMEKQNVFDDFIAAAEFLIDNKYTSKEKLAIRGGSNGGLLVGAVMTQRPDLMQVALPAVGVMDMLRYHTFTAGAGWAYDYGTAEQSKEMFEYLIGYSPVHSVKKGVAYPATLVTTGDHDDRVVPAHSYKFAANLQAKQGGNAPTLIRIETQAGHGAGTPVSKTIEQYADIFGFTLFNMGVEQLPELDNE
ncbi:MAG: prolyl oligopeptidase [Candidatus Azotimanducaceae bacterium]|jgi:prolyl oligopeptidase